MEAKLYIVVVIYQNLIEKFISSTCIPLDNNNITVIFFDNSNQEKYLEPNEQFSKESNYIYLSNSSNVGLSKAYNAAIRWILNCGERNNAWFMTLDQDTIISREYFENILNSISETQSFPVKTGLIQFNKRIGSPVSLNPQKSIQMYQENGKKYISECVAINSCLVINLNLLESINFYDEDLFLDMIDYLLFFKLRQIGIDRIEILDGKIFQSFSGDSFGSIESDRRRFNIYKTDLKKFYRKTDMSWRTFQIILLKRRINLIIHHRKFF